ncbi:sulfotransferase family protein [Roseinatronobacter sp.]|uniref:sulfotransferase family protein n=1 Tax=Roseinatronobacter sp. TaxID=1945755 RepID=UPI0025E5884A|nr:sulfotransferase [Roseibaca sp.]
MPHPEVTHQPSPSSIAVGSEQVGPEHAAPVIVFGALRSGTTLLRLMLNAHPDLNNPGEVDFLTDHIRRAPDAPTGWRYDLAALRADRMFRAQQIEIPDGLDGLDLTHALLQRLAAKKARGLLCVSMHRDLPLAVELLPGTRVVHLLRDPRDVARSSVDMGWAGTLYHASDHWVRSELEWDRCREMLRPQDWVELHFEALMDAPEVELARICDFLGVPYSSTMLTYPEHSTYAAPNPKIVRQWVHGCASQDIKDLEGKIAPLMTARGYQPSAAPTQAPGRVRRVRLALRHKFGTWAFGVRNYGAVPFFGARISSKLRLTGLQRHFQRRIDAQIRRMLR